MAQLQMKAVSEAEARKIAARILKERFKQYGFRGVAVKEEEDFSGEPILRMIVNVGKPVPTTELVDTIDDIRVALADEGEVRQVYLRTNLPEQDEAEEDVEE